MRKTGDCFPYIADTFFTLEIFVTDFDETKMVRLFVGVYLIIYLLIIIQMKYYILQNVI